MSTTVSNRTGTHESRVARVNGKLALSGKDRGFTIIELLVVMAIIGLLAAIAIPVFSKLKGNAYDSASQSDLRQAAIQTESYGTTKGSYPVTGAAWATAVGGSVDWTNAPAVELYQYVGTADVTSTDLSGSKFAIAVKDTRTNTVYCYRSNLGGFAPANTTFIGCTP